MYNKQFKSYGGFTVSSMFKTIPADLLLTTTWVTIIFKTSLGICFYQYKSDHTVIPIRLRTLRHSTGKATYQNWA